MNQNWKWRKRGGKYFIFLHQNWGGNWGGKCFTNLPLQAHVRFQKLVILFTFITAVKRGNLSWLPRVTFPFRLPPLYRLKAILIQTTPTPLTIPATTVYMALAYQDILIESKSAVRDMTLNGRACEPVSALDIQKAVINFKGPYVTQRAVYMHFQVPHRPSANQTLVLKATGTYKRNQQGMCVEGSVGV